VRCQCRGSLRDPTGCWFSSFPIPAGHPFRNEERWIAERSTTLVDPDAPGPRVGTNHPRGRSPGRNSETITASVREDHATNGVRATSRRRASVVDRSAIQRAVGFHPSRFPRAIRFGMKSVGSRSDPRLWLTQTLLNRASVPITHEADRRAGALKRSQPRCVRTTRRTARGQARGEVPVSWIAPRSNGLLVFILPNSRGPSVSE